MLKRLLVTQITVPRGRRKPTDERISSVAASMKEIGQLHAITVNPEYRLIAGLTRLSAAKSLSWADISCNIIDVDTLHAELAEIDENIERSDLTALDQAQALARRKAIYLELYPETAQHTAGAVAANGSKTTVSPEKNGKTATRKMRVATPNSPKAGDAVSVPSFAHDAAAKTGKSASTIRRSVAIGEAIAPEAAKALRGTATADNQSQLAQLVKLPAAEQVEVAKAIKSGAAQTVQEASAKATDDIETATSPDDPTVDDIMSSKNKEIEAFCRKLLAMAEAEMPTDEWIKHNGRGEQALQKIRDACATLRSCKCSGTCPKCGGEGCDRCLKTGRVTRYMMEQLS